MTDIMRLHQISADMMELANQNGNPLLPDFLRAYALLVLRIAQGLPECAHCDHDIGPHRTTCDIAEYDAMAPRERVASAIALRQTC